jgi:hypothetical protein
MTPLNSDPQTLKLSRSTHNEKLMFWRTFVVVQEPGAIYLHEMTEPFIGISESGIPWDIQNRILPDMDFAI